MKKYTKEDLELAIKLVTDGTSLRRSSALTGVPFMTIRDHTKGKYSGIDTRHGGSSTLSDSEEISLVNYAKYMCDHGFPLNRKILKKLAVEIVVSRKTQTFSKLNPEKGPTNKWVKRFLKRHPDISLRTPHPIEKDRSLVSGGQIDQYFELLDETLKELGIENDPTRVFNLDETGFTGKEFSKQKILVTKGKKHPYQPVASVNGHVTLNAAISAAGKVVAPLVIFSKNFPRDCYDDGIPEEWSFECTQSGYINNDIFLRWFRDCFIPQCGKARPILVTMDNHNSHITKDVIDLARENNITLLCFPAHSTHILQPLDVGVFHLLKQNVSQIATSLGYAGMRSIPRHKFPKVLHLALNKIPGSDISASFLATGICPFNSQKVQRPVVEITQQQSTNDRVDSQTSQNDAQNPQKSELEANKLVKLGFISEELKYVLIDPPCLVKKPPKNRKRVENARVITNPEEANSARAPTGKTKKRGKRKLTASDTKQNKNTDKTKTKKTKITSSNDISECLIFDSETLCEICMTGSNLYTWFGCDSCTRWYHYECLPSTEQANVDLSTVTNSMWHCNTCRLEYEE